MKLSDIVFPYRVMPMRKEFSDYNNAVKFCNEHWEEHSYIVWGPKIVHYAKRYGNETLHEMAIRHDSEGELNNHFIGVIELIQSKGKKTGDFNHLELYEVTFNGALIIASKFDGEWASYLSFKPINIKGKKYLEFCTAFVLKKYRGKGFISKALWYVRDQYKTSIIGYGVLSNDGYNLFKNLNKTGRFNVCWFNIETNEKDDIDNEDGKFSGIHNNWRPLIEGGGYPLDVDIFSSHLLGGHFHLFEDVGD